MSWTPRTNCLVLHLAVPVTFECSVNGKIYARRVVPGDVHIIPQGTELAIHLSGPAELGLMTFDHGTLQAGARDVSMNGDLRLTFQFSLRERTDPELGSRIARGTEIRLRNRRIVRCGDSEPL